MYTFFPNTGFAWAFLLSLVVALGVSAYVDWRDTVIPKWLTIPLFVLGFIFSIVRAGWMGAQEGPLFFLPTGNVWLGMADGLLFALSGAVVGFGMLFLMWLLKTCGGGDVKLFAALGTWLGPIYPIFVLAGSLVVLFVQVIYKLVSLGFSSKNWRKMAQANRPNEDEAPAPPKFRITYSFPVAVAALVVLLWLFRADLGLAQPKLPEKDSHAHAHTRHA
jgi:Flp pilus assembly protein protease CpaA